MESLQDFIIAITLFINNILIPFLFGLALLFFIFNAFRYLILGANADAQENARKLAMYGIGAFVLLVSIWGIVNLLVSGLGFNNDRYVVPDYMQGNPFYQENQRQSDYCYTHPYSLDCQ